MNFTSGLRGCRGGAVGQVMMTRGMWNFSVSIHMITRLRRTSPQSTLLLVVRLRRRIHYIISQHITSQHITSHYITLHYITLHYITLHLHNITLHYITLHYTTLHYTTLHYITLHYITLHIVYSIAAGLSVTHITYKAINSYGVLNFNQFEPVFHWQSFRQRIVFWSSD